MSKEGPDHKRKVFHDQIKKARYGIVYAEWNSHITEALRDGAYNLLQELGVPEKNILVQSVSGAFELPLGALYLSQQCDAVICIGCLIKGETPHFHYISEVVSHRLSELNIQQGKPFSFGLLTVNNEEEALARAGGEFGNKGAEAAEAAVNLLSLKYLL